MCLLSIRVGWDNSLEVFSTSVIYDYLALGYFRDAIPWLISCISSLPRPFCQDPTGRREERSASSGVLH